MRQDVATLLLLADVQNLKEPTIETIDSLKKAKDLQKEVVSQDLENPSYENLITATLDISGQDYKDWSATPDANTWIYNWAAGKLNLVLITE
jgi:hypothetical protein